MTQVPESDEGVLLVSVVGLSIAMFLFFCSAGFSGVLGSGIQDWMLGILSSIGLDIKNIFDRTGNALQSTPH